jgi:WD40 repeat protein
MGHFRSRLLSLLAFAFAGVSTVIPQQPPANPPPTSPAIAPAQARLDQTIGGLPGPGTALAYHEQTGILSAATEQGTIPYWHKDVILGIRVGDRTPNMLIGHQGPVTALARGNGSVLASAGVDKQIILWQLPDGTVLQKFPTSAITRALAMTMDGKWLASAGDDLVIQLWDLTAGQARLKLAGHTDWVLALAFSPDGKQLASGGYDGAVRLWDVASGKNLSEIGPQPSPPAKTPTGPANTVLALTFSPDSKQLALGGTDSQVHLVNVADGKIIRSLPGHATSVVSLAFHPSGTLLVSGSKDRSLRLWNPATGQLIKALEGHTAWVQGVTFVAQATRVASVGADQTVRLWDLTAAQK